MTAQISKPLTLVMKIKSPADFAALEKLLGGFASLPPDENPIDIAMTKVGTVHFARFVFLDQDHLAVITSYDGDFDVYIRAFAAILGDIFDALLSHMSDAPPLPVQNNIAEFLAYIKKNDLSNGISLYSAYPTLSVQDILGLAGGG